VTDLEACVDALLSGAGDRTARAALERLEAALAATLTRARRTLGEITVAAIAQRALATTRESFAVLSDATLDANGARLLPGPAREPTPELVAAARALAISLLSVLDLVTARILTPALLAAVSGVGTRPGEQGTDAPAGAGGPAMEARRTDRQPLPRLETGIPNLDAILEGGFVPGASVVLAGPPGSGKTILAQQICFHAATPGSRALYFDTLSEPTAKKLMFLRTLEFFDAAKLEDAVHFVDVGSHFPSQGLKRSADAIVREIDRVRPAIVVIDSFKVFDSMARSAEELRNFVYEIVVKLMAWGCTSLLLGEYPQEQFSASPIFSVIDGIITLAHREVAGERRRTLQVLKMRGTGHSPDAHPFEITGRGVAIYPPRVTVQREPALLSNGGATRMKTGVAKLDELLGEGIVRGSTILVAGTTGTGKTVFSLEFVFRGAKQFEEPGIIFAFEETAERIRFEALSLGFDLDREIDRGMVKIVYIPQPRVFADAHLLLMQEEIEKLGAKRVVIDSLSLFLTKIDEPQVVREKIYQVASLVHNAQAVGFFVTDIPFGTDRVSRFGFEETLVDGVFLLSSREEGLSRQRYIDIYKLRNTAHMKGRHTMVIGPGGITIYPRYSSPDPDQEPPPPPADTNRRIASGVSGLDELMGGGLLERSATLVYGSPGAGKTLLALQFVLEGAKHGERGIYLTLEEGPEQLVRNATRVGLPLAAAVESGMVRIEYVSQEGIRAIDFLAILSDRLKELKARRCVLDSTSHVVKYGLASDELRKLLYGLIVRFKRLDVTSIFNIETRRLCSSEPLVESDLPPIADNVVVLRYSLREEKRRHEVTVIKTRGSVHDEGTYAFSLVTGGIRVEGVPRTVGAAAPPFADKKKRRRSA
jgi:circadian clock protein KaiC